MTKPTRRRLAGTRVAGLALAATALAASAGCTREFFRNWADQDVSEAVFEKSRDPSFRIDMFTIEPPAISRFADPYDRERPPAPPDDYVTRALSPVAQNPTHRVLVPVEGTGYRDLLERWRRERVGPRRPIDIGVDIGPSGDTVVPPPSMTPSPFPPATEMEPEGVEMAPPDPRNLDPGAIDGAPGGGMTPIEGGDAPADPRRPAPDGVDSTGPSGRQSLRDDGVQTASLQFPDEVGPAQDVPPPVLPGAAEGPQRPDVLGEGADVQPFEDLTSPEEVAIETDVEAEAADSGGNLIGILKPKAIAFDEARAAGLGEEFDPYIIDARQSLTLALQNSRAYQFALEDVYIAALSVTLARFQFTPQFAAGINPSSPAGAGFGVSPGSSYRYATQETGTPASIMNIGTAAGVGKLLSFGTTIAANFANQTIINFGGANAVQTTSQSYLPLAITIPFLAGGGRAVTMESLTQAERNLLYAVRNFARFRKTFMVNVLAGGTLGSVGVSGGGGGDPTVNNGYLGLLNQVQIVENNTKNVAAYVRVEEVFQELGRGAGSTVTPLDLSQVVQNLQSQRVSLLGVQTSYRNLLDQYKQQLGLPPDLPLIPDTTLLEGFRTVFDQIDALQEKPRPILEQLVDRLPNLEEIVIDGKPVLEPFRVYFDIYKQKRPIAQRLADRQLTKSGLEEQINEILQVLQVGPQDPEMTARLRGELDLLQRQLEGVIDPRLDQADRDELARLSTLEEQAIERANDQLEPLLRSAERVALQNRLDLMNARAQLYDSWRQLAVTANALLGVFTPSLTNQVQTPLQTSNNPFGFTSQAKQFSLSLRAELPLIRVAQRNTFTQAIISYQRARRTLMQIEDSLKLNIRTEIRNLQLAYQTYEISKQAYIASLITLDQSFQRFLEPPRTGGAAAAGSSLVLQLLSGLNGVNTSQNSLISNWVSYQTQRLTLYRDLGTMPYDEWEAYYELFPAASPADSLAPVAGPGAGPAAAPGAGTVPGDVAAARP